MIEPLTVNPIDKPRIEPPGGKLPSPMLFRGWKARGVSKDLKVMFQLISFYIQHVSSTSYLFNLFVVGSLSDSFEHLHVVQYPNLPFLS